jgi:hypothetical protein
MEMGAWEKSEKSRITGDKNNREAEGETAGEIKNARAVLSVNMDSPRGAEKMNNFEKKGRQDVVDYLRKQLSGSHSGAIETETLLIWLANVERFDGKKKRRK